MHPHARSVVANGWVGTRLTLDLGSIWTLAGTHDDGKCHQDGIVVNPSVCPSK